jgi:serine/threonine protein kinase
MESRIYERYRPGTSLMLGNGNGKISIGTLIGYGGTSLVYEGESSKWGRVAIKVLNPRGGAIGGVYRGTLEGMEQCFQRECATLSRLVKFSGVTELLWAGTVPVQGGKTFAYLTSALESIGAGALKMRVEELDEILSRLHRLGVAHLDLKPQNLMVDSANKLSLIDFGSSIALCDLHRGPLSLWTSRVLVQGTKFEDWLDRSFMVEEWPDLVQLDRFLLSQLEHTK